MIALDTNVVVRYLGAAFHGSLCGKTAQGIHYCWGL